MVQILYQWVKDGSDISGETTDSLVISSLALSDDGAYYLRITSPLVSGLTLLTDSIFVNVSPIICVDPTADAGPDQLICPGDMVTIIGDTTGSVI